MKLSNLGIGTMRVNKLDDMYPAQDMLMQSGQLVQYGTGIMGYGTIRFFIEMSRTDALMLGGFKVAQIVSVIMFIIGLGMLMILSRKGKFEDLYNDNSNVEKVRF